MLPQEEPVSPRENLRQIDSTLTQHTRISAAQEERNIEIAIENEYGE